MVKFIPRLYDTRDLTAHNIFALDDAQQHYIGTVMRCKTGDRITMFNGNDGEYHGVISHKVKKNYHITIESLKTPASTLPPLTLAFAVIKSKPLEWMITKAVELGATQLQPIICDQGQGKWSKEHKLNHWALEAVQQCGRLAMPQINDPIAFADITQFCDDHHVMICCENDCIAPQESIKQAIMTSCGAGVLNPVFVIGPSGGFSVAEFAMMQGWANDQAQNVTLISLGRHILRAETAATAALSCWQAISDHWYKD